MDSQAPAKEQSHFEKVLDFGSPLRILENNPPGLDIVDPQDLFHQDRIPLFLDKIMMDNLEANKKFGFYTYPRTSVISDKAAILVGSSPAIKKNLNAMRDIDDGFVVTAANSVYKYLLNEGIRVDFVFLCEAADHVCSHFEGDDAGKGLSLIASPFANTKALDAWKGNLWFYICGGGHKTNELMKQHFKVEDVDIGGGNVVEYCSMLGEQVSQD